MTRTDREQISAALCLLQAAQYHGELGQTRAHDEAAQARELLSALLARHGVHISAQPDHSALAAIDRRRECMLTQLEDGLAALLDAGVIARVAA